MSETGFTPKIIGFMCNWCSYAGADLCGVSRYQYPTNIRVIRVMCSARIDPPLVLEAIREGADGVLIGGCHIGDCHYISGNFYTVKKVKLIHKVIEKLGIERERVRLEWISASEGERFSRVVREFTEDITDLGRLEVGKTDISAAIRCLSEPRLRTLAAKDLKITEKENAYGEQIAAEELDRLMNDALEEEFQRCQILELLIEDTRSVKDLSREIDLSPDVVLSHIVALRGKNRIQVAGVDGLTPIYRGMGR